MYISMSVTFSAPGGTGPCSRWRLTSYMDAAFVLLVHRVSEIWTSRFVDTDIRLLKVQSRSRSFLWAMRLPSVLVGVVL